MCLPNIFDTIYLGTRLACEACYLFFMDISTLIPPKKLLKLKYILFLTLCICLIFVLNNFFLNDLKFLRYYIQCPDESGGEFNCLGISIIYRVSFSLFNLHFALLVICFMRNWISEKINEAFWFTKTLFFTAIFICSFYIPNYIFQYYSEIAKVFASFFIVFQIIMIIDLLYLWSETWIINYLEKNSCWGALLIISTTVLYISVLVAHIKFFNDFTEKSSFNVFLIIFNIFLILLLSILSIAGVASNGSLLCSGGVSIYETFYIWSALTNSPKQSNKLYGSHFPLNFQIFVEIILIITALIYVCQSKNYMGDEEKNKNDKIFTNNEAEILFANKNEDQNENKQEMIEINDVHEDSKIYIYFHLTMIFSTLYIAMLFSNWGVADLKEKIINVYQINENNYWIQLVFGWIIVIIYIWTLIAPKILTNRDFNS